MQAHVEARWPGLYFNPARWPTADGVIPWQLFLGYAAALFPVWAIERMNTAEAIGLALASEQDGPRLWRQVTRDAYPVEEVLNG